MNFTERFGELLSLAGTSQKVIAAKLGVTGSYISKIKRGEQVPSADFLSRLSKLVKLDQSETSSLLSLGFQKRKWLRDECALRKVAVLVGRPLPPLSLAQAFEDKMKETWGAMGEVELRLDELEKIWREVQSYFGGALTDRE